MEFVARGAEGEIVRYRDRKRYLWLLALISPLLGLATVLWFSLSQRPGVLFLPLAYTFMVIPLVDRFMGEDTHNPPDVIVPLLAQDPYYRALMYVDIVFLYVSFGAFAWTIGRYGLPWWAYVGGSLSAGLTSVDVIFIGHELGHKRSKLSRAAATAALALVSWALVRGAQSRTSRAGGHRGGQRQLTHGRERLSLRAARDSRRAETQLAAEKQRLATNGHRPLSWRNQIVRSSLLTLPIAAVVIAACGLRALPFLLIHHLHAWYGLTQANYLEHYRLLPEARGWPL